MHFFFGQVLLRKQLHTAMATGHALALQHAWRQTTLRQPAGRVAGTCQFLFQLGLLFSFELGDTAVEFTHTNPRKSSRGPSERHDSHPPLFDPAKTDSSHNLDRENSPLGSGKFRYIHIYSTNLYIF